MPFDNLRSFERLPLPLRVIYSSVMVIALPLAAKKFAYGVLMRQNTIKHVLRTALASLAVNTPVKGSKI